MAGLRETIERQTFVVGVASSERSPGKVDAYYQRLRLSELAPDVQGAASRGSDLHDASKRPFGKEVHKGTQLRCLLHRATRDGFVGELPCGCRALWRRHVRGRTQQPGSLEGRLARAHRSRILKEF